MDERGKKNAGGDRRGVLAGVNSKRDGFRAEGPTRRWKTKSFVAAPPVGMHAPLDAGALVRGRKETKRQAWTLSHGLVRPRAASRAAPASKANPYLPEGRARRNWNE